MKIHEYQGKELLRQFNVPVPNGIPAFSVDEGSLTPHEKQLVEALHLGLGEHHAKL